MTHRRALDPPTESVALLTRDLVDSAVGHSRTSPRRRVIQPFHRSEDEDLHRMFNAVQPDSYVRPHRHLAPPRAEAFLVLQGAIAFFTFEDDGKLRDRFVVSRDGEVFGVDLAPGVFHCFIALEPDTVIYELKPGPYVAATDKSFAPWAPAEGDPAAPAYMARLLEALGTRAR